MSTESAGSSKTVVTTKFMDSEKEYPNPYLAASLLSPGHDHLEAVRQFLEEELESLDHRLTEIEADDGSIPEDRADEWSMVKGKLDQTRLFYGLVVKGILTGEAEDPENDA